MEHKLLYVCCAVVCLGLLVTLTGCTVDPRVRDEINDARQRWAEVANFERAIMERFKTGEITLNEANLALYKLHKEKEILRGKIDELEAEGFSITDILVEIGKYLLEASGVLGVVRIWRGSILSRKGDIGKI
jgi:hypothetical protein